MKCPKCGYNSFEFLDSCKKCSSDLSSFKESLGIRGIVLPFRPEVAVEPAAAAEVEPAFGAEPAPGHGAEDLFGWHAPAASAPAEEAGETFAEFDLGLPEQPAKAEGDAFDFGGEPLSPAAGKTQAAAEESFGDFSFEEAGAEPQSFDTGAAGQPFGEESFGDLLESSGPGDSLAGGAPEGLGGEEFPGFEETSQAAGAEAVPGFEPAAPGGEFEMEDFFLEEEPAPPAKPAPAPKQAPQALKKDEFDSLFGEEEGSGGDHSK